jgi:[acyl-carrier-protein] S-malonyltransferase
VLPSPPQSDLSLTEHAQPAILSHSYALWRVFSHTLGLTSARSVAKLAMGHSLGEYTALTVAGSLPFSTAVHLVHQRGLAMKRASPRGKGGMMAVIAGQGDGPLEVERLQQLLRECESTARQDSSDTSCVLDLANLNTPHQIVVAGSVEALEVLRERIRSGPGKNDPMTRGILRAISLDVSGAFHSRLMAPARPSLEAELKKIAWKDPSVKVVFNVHANASHKTERFHEYLSQQLTNPVRWHASILHCIRKHDVTEFIELGPSTPLSGMLKSYAKRASAPPSPLHILSNNDDDDANSASALSASIEQASWSRVRALAIQDRQTLEEACKEVTKEEEK